MEELRFDYNGTPDSFKRTAQVFLRVQASLTKTGVFNYQEGREYRSEEEVFHADSIESIKGAPVTDLHPSEKGCDNLLTPANAKEHIIGIAENIERDGSYLKGSLIIFHEDAIKAIEAGERKEISLGYKCRLEQTPGTINGESYDAIQRDIVVNHIAIGPKGWGRAGPDCSIRTDSNHPKTGLKMDEVIRLDGVDIALNAASIKSFFAEQRKRMSEMEGRLDAANLELEKKKALIAALEEPKAVSARVNARMTLLNQCKEIVGDDERLDALSDEELKLAAIKRHYPDLDLKDKGQSYIDGIFDVMTTKIERSDSLSDTRQALYKITLEQNQLMKSGSNIALTYGHFRWLLAIREVANGSGISDRKKDSPAWPKGRCHGMYGYFGNLNWRFGCSLWLIACL